MKRLQVLVATATLTLSLSNASLAGTITGSRTSSVGTIQEPEPEPSRVKSWNHHGSTREPARSGTENIVVNFAEDSAFNKIMMFMFSCL